MKKMTVSTIVLLALIGLAAGALSGMVGIGGGIILVPALVYFIGLSQFAAQGTSLAIMLPPIGILAAYNYYKQGVLDFRYVAIVAAFFILGGYVGSKVSLEYISPSTMRKIFGAFMLLASVKMLFFSK